jgi:hypothetical protein
MHCVVNQSQYDAAKDIVLDLLGWGVPPEYFVDCGLSREIVYYVFSELNLRLPQNLDITGIVPFTPDIPILAERESPVFMPPPPTTARGRRYSQGNQSLLPNTLTHNAAAILPTRSELIPALSETLQSPTASLHDMEQQRRQELLARKAAIASRRSKQYLASSDPSVPSSDDPSTVIAHNQGGAEITIPSETVDDFLKSIGPATEEAINVMDAQTSSQHRSTSEMDVDEIPGLRGVSSNTMPPLTPGPAGGGIISQVDHNKISNVSSNTSECTMQDYPPSSSDSTDTAFTQTSTESASVVSDSQSLQQRRGTKRPVASDFDLDSGPRLQINGSGYLNGVIHSGSFTKHKPTGFASVSGMRRCIIDLSDSEGEGDEDTIMRDVDNPRDRWIRRSGYSSPSPAVSSVNTPGGWLTPPVSAGMISVTGAGMSPAALAEKEFEIRRMREMIAQRERDMQKKLAAVC